MSTATSSSAAEAEPQDPAAKLDDTPDTNPKDEYTPPKIWKQDETNGGQWSSINRPTAGPRHQKELPKGKHPLQLYSLATPNGVKVTIMLEELLAAGHEGAEYDAHYIGIGDGDQFGSGFVDINPNSKIPAMLDTTTGTKMFESGSILLQLSQKFNNAFHPPELQSQVLNWLFWQMGSAPYLGGGFGHFYAYAPYKMKYPIDRFTMEVKRQLDVLERQLSGANDDNGIDKENGDGKKQKKYILGDEYTLADISIYPWYGMLVLGKGYQDAEIFLNVEEDYPNVVRWAKTVAERPAVVRGSIVNKTWGEEWEQLKERHDAKDIDEKLALRSAL